MIHFIRLTIVFILDTNDLISTSLNSEIARRALIQCTDAIVESSIDPFILVRKLHSKEVISESTYKRVRDRECRDTKEERLENILDDLKDRVKHDSSVFRTFLDTLNDLSRKDLADIIITKYKGIYYVICYILFKYYIRIRSKYKVKIEVTSNVIISTIKNNFRQNQ